MAHSKTFCKRKNSFCKAKYNFDFSGHSDKRNQHPSSLGNLGVNHEMLSAGYIIYHLKSIHDNVFV